MKLFYADTETTGLDPSATRPSSWPSSSRWTGRSSARRTSDAPPLENADAKALEVTKKTLAELATYPLRAQAFREFTETLAKYVDKYDKADKFVWIGQNPEFDVRFVRALFKEHNDNYFGSWFDSRPADLISLAVAAKVKGLIRPENFKLGTLAAEFGIEFNAHDALADVRVTRDVWMRLSAYLQPPKPKPVQAELF